MLIEIRRMEVSYRGAVEKARKLKVLVMVFKSGLSLWPASSTTTNKQTTKNTPKPEKQKGGRQPDHAESGGGSAGRSCSRGQVLWEGKAHCLKVNPPSPEWSPGLILKGGDQGMSPPRGRFHPYKGISFMH